MTDRLGRAGLHYTALEDRVSDVEALLASGTNPNLQDRDGFTALHFAAQQGSAAAASILLTRGAAVDPVNRFGNTPLFVAVFNSRGRRELIRILRAAGPDAHRKNTSGQTPAGLARLIANYDVAQFFIDVET